MVLKLQTQVLLQALKMHQSRAPHVVTTLSKIAHGTQTTDPSSVAGSQNASIKGSSLQVIENIINSAGKSNYVCWSDFNANGFQRTQLCCCWSRHSIFSAEIIK